MIVALSFLPVFTLEAQEGRLFAPLAYTKTYAMVAAALLSITLVPVLIWYLVRGRIRPENANPLNRAAMARVPAVPGVALRASVGRDRGGDRADRWRRCGPPRDSAREFMPELDEGDLLYMPTTLPGLSTDAARALLQQTDRLIRTVPEVERVFGKAGRAETATDPAPIEMFETTIMLKPRDQWRPGMTPEKLKAELDALVKFPGVSNAWVLPDQDPHRHARHRHPHAGRHQDHGSGPGDDRAARPANRDDRASRARHDVGLRRADGHRALRRHRHRPRRGRRATGSTSRTCRTSSAARSAA